MATKKKRAKSNKDLISELLDLAIDSLSNVDSNSKFKPYQFKPIEYIKKYLNWEPWGGENGKSGQLEIVEEYARILETLYEQRDYERGLIRTKDLKHYKVGTRVKNWIRVEAGHTVGKTKLASGLVSHFFDCFAPSIVYCFAPTQTQINDLLFKEIRSDRRANKELPGRVLETPMVKHKENHFIKGKATKNSQTESVQGQHEEHQMFILDEAEGIDDFVWDAVESMTGGGIAVVIMLANPRTRTSKFAKMGSASYVKTFRLSCIDHPNVVHGKEIVPNAVRRGYVTGMIDKHCSVVKKHDHDKFTFSVPWNEGIIYLPNNEFLYRVLGIAPMNSSADTFSPVGRFEVACERLKPIQAVTPNNIARIGVDVARYGNDFGTVYVFRGDKVWRESAIYKQDGYEYYSIVKELITQLVADGVNIVSVRVDGGGGYGSTLIDNLNHDENLQNIRTPNCNTCHGKVPMMYNCYKCALSLTVLEVYFNGVPYDGSQFADIVTEMYYHAGESLKNIALIDPPLGLMGDLCERQFSYTKYHGVDVKKLVSKDMFKKKKKRSPDDGDGYCLAVAPDYVFEATVDIGFA